MTPAPHVHWTCTDRGGAILNLRTARWTLLDPTAAHMWQRLTDGTDTDTLATELATTHHIPHERAGADITQLLHQADAAHLITRPRARRPR
ncbi:PqqD family protein [Embleya sp. NPDC050493]|uniref:PqqD family protein n=1 Tax=Embleya sp. NPDC050493 TaxID=3363989 RepID=UPI00378FCE4E